MAKTDLLPSDWYMAEYDGQLAYSLDHVKSLLNFASIFFKRQVVYDSHLLANNNLRNILYQEPRYLKDGLLLPVLRRDFWDKNVRGFEDVYDQWKLHPVQGIINDDGYPHFLNESTHEVLRSDSLSLQYYKVLRRGLEFEKRTNATGLSSIIDLFIKKVAEVQRSSPSRSIVYEAIDRFKLYNAAKEFSTYQARLKLIADYAHVENMANYLEIAYQYPPKIRELIVKWKLRQDFAVDIEKFLLPKFVIFEQEINPNPFDSEVLSQLDYPTIREIRKSYAAKSLWKSWERGSNIKDFQAILQAYIDTCRQLIFEHVTGVRAKRAKLRMLKAGADVSGHIALLLHHIPTDLSGVIAELSVPLILFGVDKLLDTHNEHVNFENKRKHRLSMLEQGFQAHHALIGN